MMFAWPIKLIAKAAAVVVLLLVFFGCFEVISPSERAVKVTLGTVSDTVYQPGLHLKWPIISSFKTYDLAPQTDDMLVDIGQGGAVSADNQIIGASSKVVYAYDGDRIMEIVQKYPDTGQLVKIVNNTVYEALKSEIGKYTIFDLAKNAGKIATDTRTAAAAKLTAYPIVLSQFNLTNWDWSEEFDKQINATIAAQQQVAKAKAEADRKEQEMRARTIEAEATAKALIAQAEGEKSAAELRAAAKRSEGQGISDYNRLIAQNLETEIRFRQLEIEKIKAEKWNGAYVPEYVPLTAAGGIVNLPAGQAR
jgi:regulator of protease activity HflC (stomatin/prohibitin superfamily)